MTFVVDGAEVVGKRVPSTLTNDPETGYWFALDTGVDESRPTARTAALLKRVDRYIDEVRREIVPPSYAAQRRGCVNLVESLKSALAEIKRNPGTRNVLDLFVSGISNCVTQAFYPGTEQPSKDLIVKTVLEEIPRGAARLSPKRASVCLDWAPMFGEGFLRRNTYISQEQRLVLRDAWLDIMVSWGAQQGNSPGEQLGSCLTMPMGAR
jgi:hypothetical protein